MIYGQRGALHKVYLELTRLITFVRLRAIKNEMKIIDRV